MSEGFTTARLATAAAKIHLRQGGSRPPLLLLHGYPETRVVRHKIATRLARRFTVACPDLRGYGDSSKPPGGTDHAGYAKRAMAADQVDVMARHDPLAIWREKAVDVTGRALPCGHFLPEEAPEETLAALEAFLPG